MKYRKKPVEVDAILFTGKNMDFIDKCFGDLFPTHKLWPGMWVVRGEDKCFSIWDNDIFEKTFEKVEEI